MPQPIMPDPTQYRVCPYPTCDRSVGPHYESHQANAAMAEHVRVAHVEVKAATPFVPADDRGVAA